MNVNLLPYAAFWGVLALVVLFLIVYRKVVSSHEDASLHWEGNASMEQMATAHRLESIDRWGKMLTIVAAVYGIALAVIYLYQVWNDVPTY
jgi:hypothetical protein